MTNADPDLLAVRRLSKRFLGTLALDAVDFNVRPGEAHALLGENGAGKSTLIKVLAGVHSADEGEIRWRDRVVDPSTDSLPITFIHQDLGLVDTMTVAENVAVLAGYPRRNGLISWRAAREAAAVALEGMGGGVDPDARVGDLPAAEKSIVAIARAIAVKCELLVLDEPTAALPEVDVARLLAVLRRLRSSGIGIIYVTHRLDEVFRIADRVTVLRDGRRIVTKAVADTSPAALIRDIVGRPLSDLFVKLSERRIDTLLEVDRLVAGDVGPVSFAVGAGEIVGLVGLRGAGHDVVGRAIFGDVAITSGSVSLAGRRLAVHAPVDAIRRRIGFVSSKRGEESVAPNLTVRENLFMNPVATGARPLAAIRPDEEQARSIRVLRRFSVRPPEPERVMATLSGGNQQKVVVGRALAHDPKFLLVYQPTRGIDVGAAALVQSRLIEARNAGVAVLLISFELDEVLALADRVIVMYRGAVVGTFERDAVDRARIGSLMAGAA